MTKTNGTDMTGSNAAVMSCTQHLLTQMVASENEVKKHLAKDILNILENICMWKKGSLVAEVENDNFKELLNCLSRLGTVAKKDIRHLEKTKKPDQDALIGLTGTILYQKNQEAIATPVLKKDNSEQEFEKFIELSEEKIKDIQDKVNELNQQKQRLTSMNAFCSQQNKGDLESRQNNPPVDNESNICFNHLKSLEERFNKLGGYLQEMMTKWRRHEAVCHIKYHNSKEAILKKIQLHHQHLQVVFKKACELAKEVSCSMRSEHGKKFCRDLESIIKENAWCYVQQPPKCVELKKGNSEEFTLAIIIFNVSKDEVDNISWFYFQEKSCEKNSRPALRVIDETSEPSEFGILVSATVELENYRRSTKRTSDDSFDHFNRILCKINFNLPVAKKVECCSLPFTVRTGNPQLWPYTGAVDWHCWANEDLYKAPYKCLKDMEIEKVLSLLQVIYEVIDPHGFNSDHIQTLQNMILSFTKKGSCVTMHNFIQKKMPYQKRSKQKNQNDNLDISFYTWFVAACNTAEKFKNCLIMESGNEDKSRFFASFLSFEAVLSELKGKPLGSAIVRISHNHVCSTKSCRPSAKIVVDVVSGANGDETSFAHHIIDSKDINSLVREISNLALADKDGIRTIIYPQSISFDHIKMCYPVEEVPNENGYCTKTSKKEVIQIHNYQQSTNFLSTIEAPPAAESMLNDDEAQPSPTKMPRSTDSCYQYNDESNDLPLDLQSLRRGDLVQHILSPKDEDFLKSNLSPLTNDNAIYALLNRPFENDSEHMNSE